MEIKINKTEINKTEINWTAIKKTLKLIGLKEEIISCTDLDKENEFQSYINSITCLSNRQEEKSNLCSDLILYKMINENKDKINPEYKPSELDNKFAILLNIESLQQTIDPKFYTDEEIVKNFDKIHHYFSEFNKLNKKIIYLLEKEKELSKEKEKKSLENMRDDCYRKLDMSEEKIQPKTQEEREK